jgi:hypothetical protein
MKPQIVIMHQYTVLQETERTLPILSRPILQPCYVFRKMQGKFFFFFLSFFLSLSVSFFCCCCCCGGHYIWTEGVLIILLSSNAEIPVWRIVWVTTNCHFMSDIQGVFFQFIFNLQAEEYSCNYFDFVITITFI